MGANSTIEWTDATWNVAVGCTKVDADCKFCYMYRQSLEGSRYNPLAVRKTKTVFRLPNKIKEPSLVFTSSLTDFFHPLIDDFRDEVWEIIRQCPQHTYQILTKRPERVMDNLPEFWDEIKAHVWIGTSIGSQKGILRAETLLKLRRVAPTLFLSLEPLHKSIFFDLELLAQFDWVIIGGESGNEKGKYRYRPCKLDWIKSLVDQCQSVDVPVFVKQLGTHLAKELKLKGDRHGNDISLWPEYLRIRQMPKYAKMKRLTNSKAA